MTQTPPGDHAFIAHLWHHPQLTVALFGMQVLSSEGLRLYEAAGIPGELEQSLQGAEGLLATRLLTEGNDTLILQYWRTHDDLARFARQLPHTAWWQWLNTHQGQGVAFYHEIYQCKTAEAVYEPGARPLGPAAFCETSSVRAGEGRSQERQSRFAEAQTSGSQERRS